MTNKTSVSRTNPTKTPKQVEHTKEGQAQQRLVKHINLANNTKPGQKHQALASTTNLAKTEQNEIKDTKSGEEQERLAKAANWTNTPDQYNHSNAPKA